MPSQYSTETKAEVIEMSRQGVTTPQIAQKLDIPRRTANQWLKIARDLAIAEDRDPLLVDGEYRLAFLGQRIQESQLEELAGMIERGESTLKYMVPTNITKGTSYDKIMKQPTTIQAQSIVINFIEASPPAIEGEVVERT